MSVSPPPWSTFRPHHGHFGVSDGTGLRQPGHSTGSTPGPVKRPSQTLLDRGGLLPRPHIGPLNVHPLALADSRSLQL
jgi:hypothetical protein